MMFVESYKAETASELCDIYEKKLWIKWISFLNSKILCDNIVLTSTFNSYIIILYFYVLYDLLINSVNYLNGIIDSVSD